MIRVERGDPHHPQATALLQASHALMRELFPSDSNHFLSIDALAGNGISFFMARQDDQVVGTGALANRGEYGEIKSMFVDPAARGAGVAGAILDALEVEARRQALVVLRLETGHALHDAHRLYERRGFAYRGAFGDYANDPMSLFMEKRL